VKGFAAAAGAVVTGAFSILAAVVGAVKGKRG
jgi:hypothetical protein